MLKGIVYVYTNKENGMQYYGRTLRPTRRFMQHLNAEIGKHNTYDYFHTAIREIGCQGNLEEFLKHFDFKVLNTLYYDKDTKVEVSNQLDELESRYINDNNALWPNGYNEQSYSHTVVFSLTDSQIEAAKTNRKSRKKGYKKPQITKMFFETEEERLEKHNRQSEAAKKAAAEYWSRPENIEKKEEVKRRRAAIKEQKQKEKAEYWQSEEGQARIQRNKEAASKYITEYNKSDAHRKVAAESNRRRWKDGCPEATRAKMRESARRRKEAGIKNDGGWSTRRANGNIKEPWCKGLNKEQQQIYRSLPKEERATYKEQCKNQNMI